MTQQYENDMSVSDMKKNDQKAVRCKIQEI